MKLKPKEYYAPISGLSLKTNKAHKYSSQYEIYDKNMRLIRGQTWRPFTHEVPFMGCVLQVVFEQNEDKIVIYDNKQK